MTERVDCRVFADQLDRLVDGSLPDEGRRQLLAHAGGCRECAGQRRVKEVLATPSLEALEREAPDALVEGMYSRVMAEVAPARRPERPWVPLLAAATVVLLVCTGWLGLRVGELQERETRLELELDAQRARVAALSRPASGAAGSTSPASGAWLRLLALSRQETITVTELTEILGRVPRNRLVLTEDRLRLLRAGPAFRPGGCGRPPGGAAGGRRRQGRDPPAGGGLGPNPPEPHRPHRRAGGTPELNGDDP